MAEIVNLRRVKKTLAKASAAAKAATNRASHGRTRAEREAAAQRDALLERQLDGARLDGDGKPPE